MTWEWVAPVVTGMNAAISTAAVFYTARAGRTHAERVANDSIAAARILAHQERVQTDRAAAYVEALTLLENFTLWAERVSPPLDTDPPAADPPLPSDADQVRVRALLSAHGSPEVLAGFEESMAAARRVASAVRLVRRRHEQAKVAPPGTIDTMAPWNELEDVARPQQRLARETLASRVSAELRSLPPDPIPAPLVEPARVDGT